MTRFREPPTYAAWQHRDSRRGFEVVFVSPEPGRYRLDGSTAAVEGDEAWAVRYAIVVDSGWRTITAEVAARSSVGTGETALRTDGRGRWEVNGRHAPELDGCVDVDLESSAVTNAFPVHRLGLAVGERADAPAAYVRAADLSVGRLEQRYLRLPDESGRERYRYLAPEFDFECELVYDESGLVLDYPGIATRAA